ncbi:MAG: efflux RND transporter periplasmic adaptor subunit [Planctomycetes bacterium]|nr:efflux RND transporter periplasmic adaptor subunit [Planctomycetota bacterium]
MSTALLTATVALAALACAGCSKEAPHAEADHHDHAHEKPGAQDESVPHDHAGEKPGAHDESVPHHHAAEKPGAHDESAPHDHAHDHASEGEHSDEVQLTAEAVARYGIKVEAAQHMLLKPTFVAPARVAFNTEAMAHVGSPLRGRVVELPARLGAQVLKGDTLAVIESPELGEAQAEYFQKRTAAEMSKPSMELARISWERAKGLYEKSQGISLTEVQRREGEYFAAVAAQKLAQASVIGGENRLILLGMSKSGIEALAATGEIMPRYSILAAIDGQIVEREVTLGELVGPDRETLMVLANMSTLWVIADVPEARMHEVSLGAKALVTIGTVGSKVFEGTVAFISPLVDPNTRTASVRIEVPAAAMSLKPGMFAQAEIVASSEAEGGAGKPIVAVPDEAVQTVEGGPAVFVPVPDEPNTFAKRAVTVGKSVGGLVPVYSGLAVGEKFVAAGSFILKAELGKGSAAHEH